MDLLAHSLHYSSPVAIGAKRIKVGPAAELIGS